MYGSACAFGIRMGRWVRGVHASDGRFHSWSDVDRVRCVRDVDEPASGWIGVLCVNGSWGSGGPRPISRDRSQVKPASTLYRYNRA